MEEIKKPKKRGRKPKKENKDIKEKKEYTINDNLIIKLNHINDNNDIIEPYSINETLNTSLYEGDKGKCGELCWNCCHAFNSVTHGIPLKYINKIFYVYGDFCSLECCARYTMDNFTEPFETLSLINLYNNIIHGTRDKHIEIAPNKLLLNIFGGPLTIEEYRSGFSNKNIHDIKVPPILPIKHMVDTYEINNNNNNNKGHLKLYRKKPLQSEKKSITNSMNLSIN